MIPLLDVEPGTSEMKGEASSGIGLASWLFWCVSTSELDVESAPMRRISLLASSVYDFCVSVGVWSIDSGLPFGFPF